jgi:hypothetical protein
MGLSPESWTVPTEDADARKAPVVWLPWFGGAVLGAAAALALFMALPRAQSPVIHGIELSVVTPGTMRGSDSTVLSLSPGTTAFILATALPSDMEAGTRPVLVVIDPFGGRLSETALGAAPWSPPSTQVVLVADPEFAVGDYRVQLEFPGEPEPRVLGGFRIEYSR